MAKLGKIVQVIGPVIDIRFTENELPLLNHAIQIKKGNGYGASEAPWFPWNSCRDGSHVCPHVKTVATHGAF